jgi:2-polyprenyl-3-methyl-5-hydroxy-6-metoxy-1,4-benzoquinol methylase
VPYELHLDPRSSHQRIAAYLRRLGRGPILDVGAASGALGRLLAGSGLEIDGLEPDPPSAAEATPFYRSITVSTIEEADLPTSAYQVIVLADVLEHLPRPDLVLQRLRAAATPDAVYVISLPNVAHIAARGLLAAGKFPRHDRGIFDRTHLHFFTRDTALELLRAAQLEPILVATTPVPLEHIWPDRLGPRLLELAMRVQDAAGRAAPRLFAFQWLIVARDVSVREEKRTAR